MSVLCDWQIEDLAKTMQLVTPYDGDLVNPASIDLRVGSYGRLERNYPLPPRPNDELWDDPFPLDNGHKLQRGESILLDTLEYVRIPENLMAEMWLKSSAGRNGGDMYKAGYIDPGFHGTLTFRYRNDMRRPILILTGARLVQMVLRYMAAVPANSYKVIGRYFAQSGPTPARTNQ